MKNVSKQQTITQQLSELTAVPSNINIESLQTDLNKLTQDLNTLKEINSIIEHNLDVDAKIKLLNLDKEYPPINSDELLNIKEKNQKYQENFQLAQSIGLKYTSKEIADKRVEFHKLADHMNMVKSKLTILGRIKELKDKLGKTSNTSVTEQMVNEYKQQIQEIKQGLDILICPHCQQSVRYINSTLVKTESSLLTTQKDLERVENMYAQTTRELESKR